MTNHRKPQVHPGAWATRFALQRKRDDHFLASVQIPYAWTGRANSRRTHLNICDTRRHLCRST